MERVIGTIPQTYFLLEKEIINWSGEKLHGIGHCRKHDKYAMLEIAIYKVAKLPIGQDNSNNNVVIYDNSSWFDWKLSDSEFPVDVYRYGRNELIQSIQSVIDFFSIIRRETLPMKFEIIGAGYGETDAWGRGIVRMAFENALVSCFDSELFEKELIYQRRHHYKDGKKHCSHI